MNHSKKECLESNVELFRYKLEILKDYTCDASFEIRERSEIIRRGGLQIQKYCKIEKFNPSRYISIKNCDLPNAKTKKVRPFPVLPVSVIFGPKAQHAITLINREFST